MKNRLVFVPVIRRVHLINFPPLSPHSLLISQKEEVSGYRVARQLTRSWFTRSREFGAQRIFIGSLFLSREL